jgi:hypothetical protein
MSLKFQHHSPTGNGDVLDIVNKNARLSEIIVSDILDSDHLPIIFHLLDHIRPGRQIYRLGAVSTLGL